MKTVAESIRKLSTLIEAQDPIEDKPNNIYRQVHPLAIKIGISNMVDRSKTEIIEGMVQGTNSLYRLILRRNAQLTKDVIERIKRNEDYFNVIQWSAKAMEVQLWWPYESPEEKKAPPAPRTGIPPAPPK
jgi:hypothetical protein